MGWVLSHPAVSGGQHKQFWHSCAAGSHSVLCPRFYSCWVQSPHGSPSRNGNGSWFHTATLKGQLLLKPGPH